MWEAVHKNVVDNWSDDNVFPSFSEMNFEQPEWEEVEPNASKDEFLSVDSHLKHSKPSDLGEYIDRATMLYVPSMRNPRANKKELANLQAILLAPITCTLPLIELMKVKTELWEGLTKNLVSQGVLTRVDSIN